MLPTVYYICFLDSEHKTQVLLRNILIDISCQSTRTATALCGLRVVCNSFNIYTAINENFVSYDKNTDNAFAIKYLVNIFQENTLVSNNFSQ